MSRYLKVGALAGFAAWLLIAAFFGTRDEPPKRICVEGFLVYKTPAGSDLVRGPDGHALKCEVK
jgi:hypothetical protein